MLYGSMFIGLFYYMVYIYMSDRLNASGGCEAAVTARVRIEWVRFRECGELLLGNRFPLKMKGKVYRCCVRSAILYGSETWCPKENEKAILRRTERAMVRAMCGQKVADRKTTEEQMDMLGLKETIDRLATANGVRWYGHVLRRDDDSVLRVALNLEVSGKRKRGRPKKTWKKQVEEETEKIGWKEDALRRDKCRDGVRAIAEGMGSIRPSLLKGQHRIKTKSLLHVTEVLRYANALLRSRRHRQGFIFSFCCKHKLTNLIAS